MIVLENMVRWCSFVKLRKSVIRISTPEIDDSFHRPVYGHHGGRQ